MQSGLQKCKKPLRKHITTACDHCRESKIKCDGETPVCYNCQRKGKFCRYQRGDDKRKISLRGATALLSVRIDQLCQFIYEHGLKPPPMNHDDEMSMNRILETLQIPRSVLSKANEDVGGIEQTETSLGIGQNPPTHGQPVAGSVQAGQIESPGSQKTAPNAHSFLPGIEGAEILLSDDPSVHEQYGTKDWDFALPTAESLDHIIANYQGLTPAFTKNHALSPFPNSQFGLRGIQRPGLCSAHNQSTADDESNSTEDDEEENEVIEQLSNRMGRLKIAGDGHLRFYGATSNLNLLDVWSTQQRQRPDARSVRHDGQDILNHLGIGQPVDQELEDDLLELYFTWQNPSVYVVDKTMYMNSRKQWRKELIDTPFYSEVLTNAMCAVGSAFEARYHPTFITFPKSLSEFFADRAKALLEIELDTPCVATVQALVILSYHEGACNRDARGWLYSGMSMRLAFDLGLHIDMTPYVQKGDVSIADADVRRAAFWGSYITDHFWGFYLGRPFRINVGDITVPKLASNLNLEENDMWYPYGLDRSSGLLKCGLRNPNELISRQFAVLWEMISPVGHILYGCSDISRHELQQITHRVTQSLFAWKANLPSNLQVDLDDANSPKLPHLLILHMQYHQIVIFFHRPWVSKYYIQPRSPRQGPGYLHARRMCIESATAIARLLHLYETQYTFRRLNNQAIAMIFTAALLLLFVTISPTPLIQGTTSGSDRSTTASNADMVAYLNLCFRALDELGQSFENAKRTRDFLVSLQRRWQVIMRRSGKRQMSIDDLRRHQSFYSYQTTDLKDEANLPKRSRLNVAVAGLPDILVQASGDSTGLVSVSADLFLSQHDIDHRYPFDQEHPLAGVDQGAPHVLPSQQGELDWIRDSDLQLLSDRRAQGIDHDGAARYGSRSSLSPSSFTDTNPWWATLEAPRTFGEPTP